MTMLTMHQWLRIFIMSLFFLTVTGCHSIGPSRISADRGNYDDAVATTNEEQLLKNIVRIRYSEPVFNMRVTNVTASYSLTSSIDNKTGSPGPVVAHTSNKSALAGSSSSTVWGGGIYPGVRYSDSPTLSYVPVDDATFVKAQQTPLSFDELVLLFHGGAHNPVLLSRLIFKSIGNLDNASFATGLGTNQITDNYQDYLHFVDALSRSLYAGNVQVIPVYFRKKTALMIHFNQTTNTKDTATIKKLLGMPENIKDIVLADEGLAQPIIERNDMIYIDHSKHAKNVVDVQFRSILGIMVFLSHAVQVPPEDIKAHRVSVPVDANGRVFNWAPLMNGVMTIYSSDSEPQNAFVKTKIHNHWFYISNSDQRSKVTFTLVVRLMTIMTGGNQLKSQAPVVTIPV